MARNSLCDVGLVRVEGSTSTDPNFVLLQLAQQPTGALPVIGHRTSRLGAVKIGRTSLSLREVQVAGGRNRGPESPHATGVILCRPVPGTYRAILAKECRGLHISRAKKKKKKKNCGSASKRRNAWNQPGRASETDRHGATSPSFERTFVACSFRVVGGGLGEHGVEVEDHEGEEGRERCGERVRGHIRSKVKAARRRKSRLTA
jgi:hypothetical protein